MKKIILIALVLFGLILVGCNDNPAKEVEIFIDYTKVCQSSPYSKIYKSGSTVNEPTPEGIDVSLIESYILEDGTVITFPFVIEEDTYITARPAGEKYTYTYYNYDKSVVLKQVTGYKGDKIIPPTEIPTKPATDFAVYEFIEWSNVSDILTENIEITPSFKTVFKEFTVNYYNKGEQIGTEKVKYGSFVTTPEIKPLVINDNNVERFVGWKNKKTGVDFDLLNEVNFDLDLEVKWSCKPLSKKSLEESTISFLGDSITTFYSPTSKVNSYYSVDGQFYYPKYCPSVDTVEKTWWYQVVNNVGAKLGINNSLSGSTAVNSGESEKRLETLDENGNPDIVFVFMGVNDNGSGHKVEELESAYERIIAYIVNNYTVEDDDTIQIPQIYLLTNHYTAYHKTASHGNYTDVRREIYNKMFKSLAEKYDYVDIMDIASVITPETYTRYMADNLHFNVAGHEAVSTYITDELKKQYK